MIATPTIMHSGTRVLRNQILKGIEMVTFHLNEPKLDKLDGCLIFTSLRHPRRIAESFRKRRERLNNEIYSEKSLDGQWRVLIDTIAKCNPIYLHVDHEIRDKEVKLMAKRLNTELENDFSINGNYMGTHNIDIDQCPEVPQEYIDFYYSTIEMQNG